MADEPTSWSAPPAGSLLARGGGRSAGMQPDAPGRKLLKRCRALRRMANLRVKDEELEKEYDKIADFFQSEKSKTEKKDLVTRVNQLYPSVRLGMAGLATKMPEIMAVSRDPLGGGASAAAAMTAALNFNAEEERFNPEVRDWLINALALHYGCLKWGVTEAGLMWLESCHPLSIRVDPTLEKFDPHRGRYVSHTFAKSVAAMRESRLYPESSLRALMGSAAKVAGVPGAPTEDGVMAFVTEHYLWDGGRLFLVVEAGGFDDPVRPVQELDRAVFAKAPFEFLFFSHKLKGFFPIAEPTLYQAQMMEVDALRSRAQVHASRANVRIIVNGKLIKNPQEQSRIASSEPWVITVADGNVDEAIRILDPNNMGHAIYREGELAAKETIYEITGYGTGPREQPSTPSSPATKFAIDQQNMLARQTDREQMVKDALVEVFKCAARVLQRHLAVPLAKKIAGRADVVNVGGRDQLQGDFEFKFYAFNAYAKDRATTRREAMELYELMLKNPLANQVKNMIQLLEAYDRTDTAEWFNPIAVQQLAPYALPPGGPEAPGMVDALAGPAGPTAAETNLQLDETGAAEAAPPLDFAQLARQMAGGG